MRHRVEKMEVQVQSERSRRVKVQTIVKVTKMEQPHPKGGMVAKQYADVAKRGDVMKATVTWGTHKT